MNLLKIALFSTLALASAALDAHAQSPDAASPAPALPTFPEHLSIEVPNAWSLLPGLSKSLTETASETSYFGSEASRSQAIAHGRASRGALYVTWVKSDAAIIDAEQALRDAFDSLHEAPYLASAAGSTQEISYRERGFDGVSEMTWEWAHMENQTINMVRVLGWRDDSSHLHLDIAECLFPKDVAAANRPLCEASLASMQLAASTTRTALQALAAPRNIVPIAKADLSVPKLKTENLSDLSVGLPPKEIGEVLYTGKAPTPKEDNSNRIFIGIGIALLGLAVWLTTRSDNEAKSWSKDDPKVDPEAPAPEEEEVSEDDETSEATQPTPPKEKQ